MLKLLLKAKRYLMTVPCDSEIPFTPNRVKPGKDTVHEALLKDVSGQADSPTGALDSGGCDGCVAQIPARRDPAQLRCGHATLALVGYFYLGANAPPRA